jgi:hypothetical protein
LEAVVTRRNEALDALVNIAGYEYNYISVTLVVEIVKFVMSAFFLWRDRTRERVVRTSALRNGDTRGDDDIEDGSAATKATSGSAGGSLGVDFAHELSVAGFIERLPFAAPAFVYFLKNNLMFYGLKYLNPVQFQLLGNLKIPATAILYWMMLKKPLGDLGWCVAYVVLHTV